LASASLIHRQNPNHRYKLLAIAAHSYNGAFDLISLNSQHETDVRDTTHHPTNTKRSEVGKESEINPNAPLYEWRNRQ